MPYTQDNKRCPTVWWMKWVREFLHLSIAQLPNFYDVKGGITEAQRYLEEITGKGELKIVKYSTKMV